MNLQVLLIGGGILLTCILFGAGYKVGSNIAASECLEAANKQAHDFDEALKVRDKNVDEAAQKAWALQKALDESQRVKAKEVIRYVRSPAATVACLDADGMRVWNDDADTSPGPVRPEPDGLRASEPDETDQR